MNSTNFTKIVFAGIVVFFSAAHSELRWPEDQLLPWFSAPAEVLDLMDLSKTRTMSWEAESAAFSHPTGRQDGNGWLCQTVTDQVGYMLVGPTDSDFIAGSGRVTFKILIDNNTAANNLQVTISIYDATRGVELAKREINRHDFSSANTFLDFGQDYTNPNFGNKIEYRAYWHGGAYIKIDDVRVQSRTSADEKVMLTTLKGLVNRTQPRIFSFDNNETGKFNWLNSLNLKYEEVGDNWTLVTKYRSSIQGLVVYDKTAPDATNLATTIAGVKGCIAVTPVLMNRLTKEPYNLPVVTDLRGMFTNKLQVYEYLYNNYWSQVTHRVIVSLNPQVHHGKVRDYATALGAAVIWLDPREAEQKTLLDKFLSDMPRGRGVTLGWWHEEASGITAVSEHGLATCPSDWSENLTVFGGMSRTLTIKPIPPKPRLENKIYVTLILSDGDNLQYLEGKMKNIWDLKERGSIPLGWTVSPVMIDAMPAVLDYYYRTATDNDCFVSGPSGFGYTYPNFWPDSTDLGRFVNMTDQYLQKVGIHVVTIWNTITGGNSPATGRAYAKNSSTILGITGMKGGGGITIYNNSLPSQELHATYCFDQASTIKEITNAIAKWNGTSPYFVAIQANPWQSKYQDLVNAVDHFKSNTNMTFVRTDTYFQLLREAHGLLYDIATPVMPQKGPATAHPQIRFNAITSRVSISGSMTADRGVLTIYTVKGRKVLESRGVPAVSLKELPAGTFVAVFRQGTAVSRMQCVKVR